MQVEPTISTKMFYDTRTEVVYNRPVEMTLSYCDIGLEEVEIIITCRQSVEKTEALVKHLQKAMQLELVRFEMDYKEKKPKMFLEELKCMCDSNYKCLTCRGLSPCVCSAQEKCHICDSVYSK